jgi:hypothetical protein
MTAKSVFLASGALVALASPRALAATDYDRDGRSDLAFHRPDGSWNAVSILLSTGDGWSGVSKAVPSWANETGAIALPGDFNGDGRTDIAFHRPGGGWTTVPVLLANGSGGWTAVASTAPKWANEPGTVAIGGDYDGDCRSDLAFHRPSSSWTTVLVLRSNGDGKWTASTAPALAWANQSGGGGPGRRASARGMPPLDRSEGVLPDESRAARPRGVSFTLEGGGDPIGVGAEP